MGSKPDMMYYIAGSLYKTYVQPVLMYGLEIVQPKQTNLKKLEVFQKNILKQILSLPTNAPDPAIYIISGLLMSDFHMDFFGGFATNSLMFKKSYLINVFLRIVNQLILSVVLMLS
jgi:hypothetical protein